MADGMEIKVDVKAFSAASEEISTMIKSLEQSMQSYFNGASSLRSVWQGDGSNNIKGMINSMMGATDMLISNLSKYPKALNEVAGIYTTSEKQLEEAGKSLSFDSGSMT